MKSAAHSISRFSRYFFVIVFGILIIATALNLLLPNNKKVTNSSPQHVATNTQTNSLNPQQYSINTNLKKDENTRIQSMVIHVSAALICQLAGIDVINPSQGCVTIDPITNKLGYAPISPGQPQIGGVLGFSTTMIASLYNQPVSSGQYIASLKNNFGFSEKAFAQSSDGFTVLSPLQSLWTTIRNLTYVIFILIFVIIGVGIMLRVKIDPRTSMTIQNQIPRIVVALILITFSYAIAGLFVDLMWAVSYTGINLVATADSDCANTTKPIAVMATENVLNNPIYFLNSLFNEDTGCMGKVGGIISIAADVGLTLGDVFSRTIISAIHLNETIPSCDGITDFGDCFTAGVFGFFKYLIGVLAILILIVAIVTALIRLWFVLIRSFVYIILGTIAGPLFIAAGLLPGSSLGFTNWLRFMAAHTLVFPATILLIVIARVIYTTPGINNPTSPQASLMPPLVGNPNATDNFGFLIVIGIIFILPEILNLLRDALKTQPNKYLSPAISKGFSRGVGPVTAPIAAQWSRLTRFDPHKNEVGALAGYVKNKTQGNRWINRLNGVRRLTEDEKAGNWGAKSKKDT